MFCIAVKSNPDAPPPVALILTTLFFSSTSNSTFSPATIGKFTLIGISKISFSKSSVAAQKVPS
jgi:hypothetical protein